MKIDNLIPIQHLCLHYKMEQSFFGNLNEIGLVNLIVVKEKPYVHKDSLDELEKIIRMHKELDVNAEGIDVAFHLLRKIDFLQNELHSIRSRLLLYENFDVKS